MGFKTFYPAVALTSLFALAVFYQNCAEVTFSTIHSVDQSSNFSLDMSPICIDSTKVITITINGYDDTELVVNCRQNLPVQASGFSDCLSMDLGLASMSVSEGIIVFSDLEDTSYNITVQLVTKNSTDEFEVAFSPCQTPTTSTSSTTSTTSTTSTSTTTTTACTNSCSVNSDCGCGGICGQVNGCLTCTTTGNTCSGGNTCQNGSCAPPPECTINSDCTGACNNCVSGKCNAGTTCDDKRAGNSCKICTDANSCTETPRDVTVTCGSGSMSGFGLSREPTCPTGSNTECGVTCYTPGGQTCSQQITDSQCQKCADSNSCTEAPSDIAITCGSGLMINYALSSEPTCSTGSYTLCGVTCYAPGGQTCDDKRAGDSCKTCSNPNSCTEAPSDVQCTGVQVCQNGTCITPPQCSVNSDCAGDCNRCVNGQCSNGTTCDDKRNKDSCKVCTDASSCTETPRNVTVTCGSGSMSSYTLSREPTCPTGSTTQCGVTCYMPGGSTCNDKITDSKCQECADTNSCSESPRNKLITCGSGVMAGYSYGGDQGCGSTSKTYCNNTCWSDGSTCGSCESCSNGSCVSDCNSNQTCSNGACVDNDPCRGMTCGSCESCSNGSCVSDCNSNQTCSNGACVDNDPCRGVTCGACESCSGGSCVSDCGSGQVCSNGSCVDQCGKGSMRDYPHSSKNGCGSTSSSNGSYDCWSDGSGPPNCSGECEQLSSDGCSCVAKSGGSCGTCGTCSNGSCNDSGAPTCGECQQLSSDGCSCVAKSGGSCGTCGTCVGGACSDSGSPTCGECQQLSSDGCSCVAISGGSCGTCGTCSNGSCNDSGAPTCGECQQLSSDGCSCVAISGGSCGTCGTCSNGSCSEPSCCSDSECSGVCNSCVGGTCETGNQTCGQKRGTDYCKTCDSFMSCTEEPRSITCGEGVMKDFPLTLKPECDGEEIGSFNSDCGIICYATPDIKPCRNDPANCKECDGCGDLVSTCTSGTTCISGSCQAPTTTTNKTTF